MMKNRREALRVMRKTWEGNEYVDLRTVSAGDEEGEWHPSKKGCTISPKALPDVIAMLQQAETDLRADGLIGGDA